MLLSRPSIHPCLEQSGKTGLQAQNTMSRYVREKEIQATVVKDEIRIIWGDYFKAPQIEKFPNIHELTHSIMMTASKTKQEPTPEIARKLVDQVNEFAEIFWGSKDVETYTAKSPYAVKEDVVYPKISWGTAHWASSKCLPRYRSVSDDYGWLTKS